MQFLVLQHGGVPADPRGHGRLCGGVDPGGIAGGNQLRELVAQLLDHGRDGGVSGRCDPIAEHHLGAALRDRRQLGARLDRVIDGRLAAARAARAATVDQLRARIAALEAQLAAKG